MESRALPILLISVAVSAAVGGAVAIAVAPDAPVQADESAHADSARIASALEKLEARQGELERSLADLRDAASAASSNARSEVVDVDAAIERWMQAHSAQLAAHKGDEVAAAPQKSREQKLADALARLNDKKLGDVERQRLWREFEKEGLGDELLAEFERRVESDPSNPDLKVDLAGVYFMKIAEVGNGPEAGVWGTKADQMLDAALELDDHHWEARFTKAIALSFWPDFLGKKKEAASHLEILVAQQATQPKQDHFAQTHLFLGNMYQQLGQTDKAIAAWQTGLAQFPGNSEIKKQLDLYSAQ
jgi:tetratricopeptide (TPR) repeat protein